MLEELQELGFSTEGKFTPWVPFLDQLSRSDEFASNHVIVDLA